MTGALLSEVWPDMVKSQKKRRKRKEHRELIVPPDPDDMDKELLDDNTNDELNPYKKLKGLNISPYTDNEIQYQNNKKVNLKLNGDYHDDPEYQEFLNYKREKKYFNKSTNDEQFNELLLYIFTGFFFIMIYDNIYKLGKNGY